MGIGKRIKEAREAAHLTQKKLGELVGVGGSAITNYEQETSHPKEHVLYKLIDALGVDANFLFQDCVNTIKPEPEESLTADMERLIQSLTPEQARLLCSVAARWLETVKAKADEK